MQEIKNYDRAFVYDSKDEMFSHIDEMTQEGYYCFDKGEYMVKINGKFEWRFCGNFRK